jgi:hypothetical protein
VAVSFISMITITAGTLLACIGSVMAYVTFPFSGWPWLEQKSHDILIARCRVTPDPYAVGKDGAEHNMRGLINSEIQIVSVLKGTTNTGTARLTSEYWPRQGDYYLVFATFNFGFYQAVEKYRIVPLGPRFMTNILSGKSLELQVRTLLQYRLNMLSREMQQAQEEKKRLEEGLKQ